MTDFDQATTPPPPPPPTGLPSAEERQWAMFAHLSALLGALLTTGWLGSIGWFIGPLVIWLVKRETMPFVADQAREALNFNITLAIVFFVLFALGLLTLGIGFILTGPLMGLIGIVALVFIVIAAIKSNEGVAYRYPFALRLVK